MTITAISTNTIGTGVQHTFAATGDSLIILSGATLGSTDNVAIISTFADVEVTVLGTLFSATQVNLTAGSSFTIATGGNFTSYNQSNSNSAVFMLDGTGIVTIDGSLLAQESIGILVAGSNNLVTVSGSVQAASGVYLGLSGSSNDALVNSGRITSSSYGDVGASVEFNNGVYATGANARITNLATGVITATSSEGAGVRVVTGGSGTIVNNAGMIVSQQAWGVDFSGLIISTEEARLFNSGVIQGRVGSFYGGFGVDFVTNRGQMVGAVLLGDGADVMDSRFGRIDGFVNCGLGNDYLDARGGTVSGLMLGNQGFDTIQGGETADEIYGGTESDLLEGNGGDDYLSGDENDDIIKGGTGNDSLVGGDGQDWLYGGAGDDVLNGDTSSGRFYGGSGNDLLDGRSVVPGILIMHGGEGDDNLQAGDFADQLFGDAGDDFLETAAGADNAYGGAGDDLISNADGNDSIRGGAGDDTVNGGADADLLEGGGGDDSLTGGAGQDVINGGLGFDILLGGADRDTLQGGADADTLTGGAGADVLTGGTGVDVFVFGVVSDIGTLVGSRDSITDARKGIDIIDLSGIDANSTIAGNQVFTIRINSSFTNVAGELLYNTVSGILQGDTNGDGVANFGIDILNLPGLTAADFYL